MGHPQSKHVFFFPSVFQIPSGMFPGLSPTNSPWSQVKAQQLQKACQKAPAQDVWTEPTEGLTSTVLDHAEEALRRCFGKTKEGPGGFTGGSQDGSPLKAKSTAKHGGISRFFF